MNLILTYCPMRTFPRSQSTTLLNIETLSLAAASARNQAFAAG